MQMVSAPLAGKGPLRFEAIPVGFFTALRAGVALAKTTVKQMLEANFIGGELRQKLTDCYARPFFFTVFSFHGQNIPQEHTYVKGIIPKKQPKMSQAQSSSVKGRKYGPDALFSVLAERPITIMITVKIRN
jgi:hypothetical protein